MGRVKKFFFRLVYCLAFLLLAAEVSAQNESSAQPQKDSAQELLPVVVDSVKINGGAEISADEKASISLGLQGETVHSDWLARIEANAARRLQNDGFFNGAADAEVESSKVTNGKRHVVVSIALTSGPRYTVQRIWWTGSSIFSPTQLDNLCLLRVGDVFRPSALRESILLIHQAYGERGYKNMALTPQTRTDSKKGKVDLYLEVVEGPKSEAVKQSQCRQYSLEDIQNTPYIPSPTYDPKLDVQMQILRAQLEAQRANKRLLLVVGGEWCGWCRVLDQTFQRNPALTELRDKIFIVLHVDVTDETGSECALRATPRPSVCRSFMYWIQQARSLQLKILETGSRETATTHTASRGFSKNGRTFTPSGSGALAG
jgi:Surface antigen variable number repeat/Thioredoxin-like